MDDRDRSFAAAAERKLLETHPEMAELLDLLSPSDRAQFVSRWFGTFQAHRRWWRTTWSASAWSTWRAGCASARSGGETRSPAAARPFALPVAARTFGP
jgi:hypothetical protein